MASNHYVSQLIIKRFSDMKNSINVFNVDKKAILEDRKSVRIFCKDNIYSDEVEEKLNRLLEDPFAKLIDTKIIGKDKIIINRMELFLIKKFMLVDSIKTLTPAEFKKIISGFASNTKRYMSICFDVNRERLSGLKSLAELKVSDDVLFNNAMVLLLETNELIEVIEHPNSYIEIALWAKVFYDSYLSFWDCSDEQEFILTDNGMTSEYEPSHMLYGGLDHSKTSYLFAKFKENKSDDFNAFYVDTFSKQFVMYENFNIFNLSSSRSFVLINPFFRLYDTKGFSMNNNPEIYFDKPDVWPSFIETRKAFDTPITEYSVKGFFLSTDKFVYTPVKLSLFDTIYINNLFLQQLKNLLAFISFDKIVDSLICHIALRVANQKDIYTERFSDRLSKVITHISNDEYGYIFNHFKGNNTVPRISPFDYLDHYAKMCFQDTRGNKYALEYLLSQEEKVRTMENFNFMGSPDERIRLIKQDLKRLKAR